LVVNSPVRPSVLAVKSATSASVRSASVEESASVFAAIVLLSCSVRVVRSETRVSSALRRSSSVFSMRLLLCSSRLAADVMWVVLC
jgi:hypothetical protein